MKINLNKNESEKKFSFKKIIKSKIFIGAACFFLGALIVTAGNNNPQYQDKELLDTNKKISEELQNTKNELNSVKNELDEANKSKSDAETAAKEKAEKEQKDKVAEEEKAKEESTKKENNQNTAVVNTQEKPAESTPAASPAPASTQTSNNKNNTQTVYWTDSGSKFHNSATCRTFKGHTVHSGTVDQAKAAGKTDSCKVCG